MFEGARDDARAAAAPVAAVVYQMDVVPELSTVGGGRISGRNVGACGLSIATSASGTSKILEGYCI